MPLSPAYSCSLLWPLGRFLGKGTRMSISPAGIAKSKRIVTRAALVATMLLVTMEVSLLADDWPQWRGLNRDGKATGFKAPDIWPKQLTQKWKVTVGVGDSTPALVGDHLY